MNGITRNGKFIVRQNFVSLWSDGEDNICIYSLCLRYLPSLVVITQLEGTRYIESRISCSLKYETREIFNISCNILAFLYFPQFLNRKIIRILTLYYYLKKRKIPNSIINILFLKTYFLFRKRNDNIKNRNVRTVTFKLINIQQRSSKRKWKQWDVG